MSSLVMIPEAPRVSSSVYPKHWDWRIIDSELPIRMKRNGTNSNNNDDSAFGSAESTKLLEVSPEVLGTTIALRKTEITRAKKVSYFFLN